jgi:hypothetical protein
VRTNYIIIALFQRGTCEKLNVKQTENIRSPDASGLSTVENLTMLDSIIPGDELFIFVVIAR